MPRRLAALAVAGLLLVMPAAASAQYGDDADSLIRKADGRLRGYEGTGHVLDTSGTFLTYAAFAGLALLTAGVMFKSARRTHLD